MCPNRKIWKGFHAFGIIALAAALVSCKSSGPDVVEGFSSLEAYYTQSPLPRDWSLSGFTTDDNGKYVIEVLVESTNDIRLIRSKSRMNQFNIAKLACPTNASDFQKILGKQARIWVRLMSETGELTSSICPPINT